MSLGNTVQKEVYSAPGGDPVNSTKTAEKETEKGDRETTKEAHPNLAKLSKPSARKQREDEKSCSVAGKKASGKKIRVSGSHRPPSTPSAHPSPGTIEAATAAMSLEEGLGSESDEPGMGLEAVEAEGAEGAEGAEEDGEEEPEDEKVIDWTTQIVLPPKAKAW